MTKSQENPGLVRRKPALARCCQKFDHLLREVVGQAQLWDWGRGTPNSTGKQDKRTAMSPANPDYRP